jgi:hypothetical protein
MIYFGLSVRWLPQAVAIAMFILGLPVAAIGGYAGRAKALGLKPVDNSDKKARESYQTEADTQDEKNEQNDIRRGNHQGQLRRRTGGTLPVCNPSSCGCAHDYHGGGPLGD